MVSDKVGVLIPVKGSELDFSVGSVGFSHGIAVLVLNKMLFLAEDAVDLDVFAEIVTLVARFLQSADDAILQLAVCQRAEKMLTQFMAAVSAGS